MAVAVHPRPELLDDPRGLPARRIRESVAERLRPRALLLRVARVPVGVVLHAGECGLLAIGEIVHRRGVWRDDRHVQMNAEAVRGVVQSYGGRDDRAPIAA